MRYELHQNREGYFPNPFLAHSRVSMGVCWVKESAAHLLLPSFDGGELCEPTAFVLQPLFMGGRCPLSDLLRCHSHWYENQSSAASLSWQVGTDAFHHL